MKRDATHMDQVERWALFMKEHPNEWMKYHSSFIDAQFDQAYSFLHSLSKTKNGREKIIKLYNIKNVGGYKKLLG